MGRGQRDGRLPSSPYWKCGGREESAIGAGAGYAFLNFAGRHAAVVAIRHDDKAIAFDAARDHVRAKAHVGTAVLDAPALAGFLKLEANGKGAGHRLLGEHFGALSLERELDLDEEFGEAGGCGPESSGGQEKSGKNACHCCMQKG